MSLSTESSTHFWLTRPFSERSTQIFLGVLLAALALVTLLHVAVPPENPLHVGAYTVNLFGKYLSYALLAVAVDLVWGYLGILSLGHGAFFAIGGYAMGMYLVLNLPLIPLIAKILDLPKPLLLSLILIFCMIGVYGMSFSVFDLLLLLGFGLVGLGMRLFGFPAAPLILALILGNIMEESMRRALQISGGDWTTFIDKPISLSLLVIAVLSLGLPLLKKRRKKTPSSVAS